MVERITITIRKDLLRRVDSMIDGKKIKNRSHAIEHLLTGWSFVENGVILAGGSAKIGGKSIHKALIELGGIPIIDRQIKLLKNSGVRNIIVSTDSQKVKAHLDESVKCILEKTPLGSAGPLKLTKINGTFIVINVDTLLDLDIASIVDFHRKQATSATVMLSTTNKPSSFGVVRMRGNQVTEFVEKPKIKEARLFNAGVYVFEPSVLQRISGRMMIEQLFTELARERQLSGFVYDGPVVDVGTQEGYLNAKKLSL